MTVITDNWHVSFSRLKIVAVTPFHSPLQCGKPEVVSVLLDSGADAAAVDNEGRTVLHLAPLAASKAGGGGGGGVVSLLFGRLDLMPLLEATDLEGKTAAHRAAMMDNGGVLEALLKRGAAADAKDAKGGHYALALPYS